MEAFFSIRPFETHFSEILFFENQKCLFEENAFESDICKMLTLNVLSVWPLRDGVVNTVKSLI